jgi:hypothetical protein
MKAVGMRSPFWGATKYQVGEYRKYAKILNQWRRDMEQGNYSQPPNYIEDISAYAGSWQGMALHNFIMRALKRLRRREDWNDMADWFGVRRMQRDDSAAYQMYLLRKEFEEYRESHARCCHVLPER